MKALALILALASAPAMSQVLVTDNAAGGQIVLTLKPCVMDGGYEALRAMYAYGSDGVIVFGCWALIGETVRVVYDEDGKREQRTYQKADFRYEPTRKPGRTM